MSFQIYSVPLPSLPGPPSYNLWLLGRAEGSSLRSPPFSVGLGTHSPLVFHGLRRRALLASWEPWLGLTGKGSGEDHGGRGNLWARAGRGIKIGIRLGGGWVPVAWFGRLEHGWCALTSGLGFFSQLV